MALGRLPVSLAIALALGAVAGPLRAEPSGVAMVRLLGPRARAAFASPGAASLGAIVRLPPGTAGAGLGLRDIAPGLARLPGSPEAILAFADAHPDLPVEVSPPLHVLLDAAGVYVGSSAAHLAGHSGAGALVGIADTGIDVTHADFLVGTKTRVAWLLDLSSPPRGVHPELESRYGTTDEDGTLLAGAVWSKADLDAVLATDDRSSLPTDQAGHGTLVSACAAGEDPTFEGVAPQAGILVARISDPSESIATDDMLRGVEFLFDMADSMGQPIAVNLSIGTDFGPHDGTLDWEQALASHVGAAFPGHALVVAAGNSGSIVQGPIHQNVHVVPGGMMTVPFVTGAAYGDGNISAWVAMHAGADVSVGLEAPGGPWLPPVPPGSAGSTGGPGFDATGAVDNNTGVSPAYAPPGPQGAIVMMQGAWPAGVYSITLSGSGTADLYIQGLGDVGQQGQVAFVNGVREGTINLPATHPSIIGVGCTINKPSWTSITGERLGLQQLKLDGVGGRIMTPPPPGTPYDPYEDPIEGEPCWFSSAGPNLDGVPKPEIMAPGAAIVGAASEQAPPSSDDSIFMSQCPSLDGGEPSDAGECLLVDSTHGASNGTSFSSPLVAGAAAVLFAQDPSLTQGQILAALQGGAHRLRGAAPYFDDDQTGPGELDVVGALAAVDRLQDPELTLPVRSASWLTLGSNVFLADGSTPLAAIVELRAAAAPGMPAMPADGFSAGRLTAYALVDGVARPQAAPIQRVGPGVWMAKVSLPAGFGGQSLTVGAMFDGADIVDPKAIPIATDVWNGDYAPSVRGGCSVAVLDAKSRWGWLAAALASALSAASRRRARRRSHASQ
jgi:subtilisin family serine protease